MVAINLPKLFKQQEEIKRAFHNHRFVVVASGRRYGKTTLGIDLLITKALDNQYSTAFFSLTYKQLLASYDRCCHILEGVAKFDRQNKRLILPTGNTITFWSLESEGVADSVRGNKYGFVVIDEMAYVRNLIDIFNKVIRPTLIDLKGSALFIGTPNGYNDAYKLFREEQRNPYMWKSFHATSYDNPYLDKDELTELKKYLPERVFKAEILARFLDSNAGVFTNLSTLVQPVSNVGGMCAIGIDLARSGDNTSMTVMRGTTVIDLCVYQDMSYDAQVETIVTLAKKYKPEVIVIENNGLSDPIVERLANTNLPIEPFHTTNSSKKKIIENLAVAIEQGMIAVDNGLEHSQQLIDELAAYESKKNNLGTITYNAPSGYKDDMVISLALAYKAVREDDIPLIVYDD